MKITKIEVLKVKTTRPTWRPVFCRVYTDEGIYGDGEAALAYGRAADAGFAAVREFAGLIIGMDPLANEVIWEKLYKTTFWGQNGGPVIFAAIGALDMALWDIKGKYFHAPIHQLLGGACRTKLRSYASQLQNGWEYGEDNYACQTAPEGFADAARKAVAEGYDAVKFDFFEKKPGGGDFTAEDRRCFVLPKDLQTVEDRLAAVREAVGDQVDIIAEAHSRMDAPGAIRYARILEKYNVMFFEEPDTPTPYMTKYIADQVNIPLAGGERIYGRWQFVPYFEDRSLQVIQPDLGNCGGFTEVKKICDMAHAYDVSVQAHICASALSTAAAIHLEAVLPNFVIHEHHICNRITYNMGLTTEDVQPVQGYLEVPMAPGLGNEISEKAYRMADTLSVVE
ncbi:MAG: mandelate racemase/muconate lactonizing enzyme family protein [Lachnospiraceae bacterium]|nr:mandelate racemase/muconate lactonizing enzyme family protein [Lachnospiraceae bacterium]